MNELIYPRNKTIEGPFLISKKKVENLNNLVEKLEGTINDYY